MAEVVKKQFKSKYHILIWIAVLSLIFMGMVEYGYVTVRAAQIKDYSKDLEYSQEDGIHVTVRDNRNGVNHLVCAGRGENQDRIVLHLYVQKDGTIGKTQ